VDCIENGLGQQLVAITRDVSRDQLTKQFPCCASGHYARSTSNSRSITSTLNGGPTRTQATLSFRNRRSASRLAAALPLAFISQEKTACSVMWTWYLGILCAP